MPPGKHSPSDLLRLGLWLNLSVGPSRQRNNTEPCGRVPVLAIIASKVNWNCTCVNRQFTFSSITWCCWQQILFGSLQSDQNLNKIYPDISFSVWLTWENHISTDNCTQEIDRNGSDCGTNPKLIQPKYGSEFMLYWTFCTFGQWQKKRAVSAKVSVMYVTLFPDVWEIYFVHKRSKELNLIFLLSEELLDSPETRIIARKHWWSGFSLTWPLKWLLIHSSLPA